MKDEIEIKRKKALRGGKSGSRRLSGSAGTAPRRRAFSSLMLFRDLFPHFTFSGLLLTNGAYFESRLKEFCDSFGASDLFSFPLWACACLRRPTRSARASGRPPARTAFAAALVQDKHTSRPHLKNFQPFYFRTICSYSCTSKLFLQIRSSFLSLVQPNFGQPFFAVVFVTHHISKTHIVKITERTGGELVSPVPSGLRF